MSHPTFTYDAPMVILPGEEEAFVQLLRGDDAPERKKKILIQAVRDGELEFVRKAIRYGCGLPTEADGYDNTLLHYAAFFGYIEIAKFLLTGGAVVDARNNVSHTPLHLACESHLQPLEMIRMLVRSCQADIQATNMNGWTPLHIACNRGHVQVVRLLVALGADVNARAHKGDLLPADVVDPRISGENSELIRQILAAGSQRDMNLNDEKEP
eukprot:TRINITY_DN444_c0_g1_i2.p1 TRINITY_DN444_c0_g1~~TRINITY_DN444_c0_g1_i2.p1  ORF type:complete len:212 (+),score=17.10 TRINITY_DN444_c0_g1_i2:141-776(+)